MDCTDDSGDCLEAIRRLYHFLDGELDDARRVVIRRHLDTCQPCLQAFGFEAELRQLIARRCQERVPESLRVRIALAIGQEIRQEPGPVDPGRGMPPLP